MKKIFSSNWSKAILALIVILVIFGIGSCIFTKWYIGQLPVNPSTPDYPEMTLEELAERSEYIVYGKVQKVKDRDLPAVLRDLLGTGDGEEPSIPVTPVEIQVEQMLKGERESNRIIYYQDGGIRDGSMILPSGFPLEKGDQIIVFLDENGEGYGYRSEFPVDEGLVYGFEKDDLALFSSAQVLSAGESETSVIRNFISLKEISPSSELYTADLDEFLEYLSLHI
ncbi:hypothetical protein B5F07_21300 [Lachnoclostridium sp. An169]|uniref:hypothetical protein n=1 Tax=Lachnoclostridium sp. An169 TaxID=1965569 RepID=UPI000B368515|nr:hypothetical protein [Lachnoclostridium sp. An169]OUP80048.1 hypothetical protein B5F07_21300 [Lachnoclostridium sp. An169]